ncbi:MAG: hypothetical protein JJU46_14420, partial [Balneolaceae bacterium]|nr:hypothetical protein [Balneolaceae bacterium]
MFSLEDFKAPDSSGVLLCNQGVFKSSFKIFSDFWVFGLAFGCWIGYLENLSQKRSGFAGSSLDILRYRQIV